MTQTTDPAAEVRALIRELAEWPCPHCSGRGNDYSDDPSFGCQGTGLANLWASEECPYANATKYFRHGAGLTMKALQEQEHWHRKGRCKCKGSGHVPKAVGLEELLSRPRTACKLIPADEVPVLSRGRGRVRIHKLLPERIKGLEIDKMAFEPASSMGGTPHVPGTKEYLHCLEGELNVLVAGQVFPVAEGGVLAFPGDQPHSYRNRGRVPALAVSIVVPVPVSSGRD